MRQLRVVGAAALVGFVCSAAAVAADKWSEFRSVNHGFAAQFPGTPGTGVQAMGGDNPFGLYHFQLAAGSAVYDVSVAEYSPGHAPQNPGVAYYAALAERYALGAKAVVRPGSGHAVTIDGRPGYEAVADNAAANRTFLIDFTAAGDRLFYIVSMGPKGSDTGDDAKHFRDSFKFITQQ
jgi:hypothetical protein